MLIYVDGRFENSPDLAPDDVKEETLRRIENCAIAIRAKYLAPTSPYEAASWALKLDEANQGGGEILNSEAAYRGITVAELVAKVLQKAGMLASLEAQIAGASGKHSDAVLAMSSSQDVLAYDWKTGWPE